MNILFLEDEETWPSQAIEYLNNNRALFLNWKLGDGKVSIGEYEQAIQVLQDILRSDDYSLRGYHCTRLTDGEIQDIISNGMSLPNKNMLQNRIKAIEHSGLIDADISKYLIEENEADDANRAGIIWFCFFPLHCVGQNDIGYFFRWWGGEALYNSHENDVVSGPILRSIGTPCIVEAHVPITSLSLPGKLEANMVCRFLFNRDLLTVEELSYADYVEQVIPAQHISRIIRFPDEDFITLTGCDTWQQPI